METCGSGCGDQCNCGGRFVNYSGAAQSSHVQTPRGHVGQFDIRPLFHDLTGCWRWANGGQRDFGRQPAVGESLACGEGSPAACSPDLHFLTLQRWGQDASSRMLRWPPPPHLETARQEACVKRTRGCGLYPPSAATADAPAVHSHHQPHHSAWPWPAAAANSTASHSNMHSIAYSGLHGVHSWCIIQQTFPS